MKEVALRSIEVVTIVRLERTIEAYETTLELLTVAGRKVPCFDESIQLRDAILKLLHQSGLGESEIHEGGGEASQNFYAPYKSIVHRIRIRNQSMAVLMSAMASIEKYFAAIRRPLFGRIRQSFTFRAPTPVYVSNVSADESLRESLRNARRTAEVIANESGYRLGHLMSVVESSIVPKFSASGIPIDADPEGTSADRCLSEYDSIGEISYTGLPPSTSRATRRFQVRFAIEEVEQSQAPKPSTVRS